MNTLSGAFGYLVNHWHRASTLIEGSPELALTLLIIGWAASRLLNQSTISGLRERISLLEGHIAFLTDQLKYSQRPRKGR